jgi:hypothetical protein
MVIVSARVVPGWREVIHWHLSPGVYVAEAALGLFMLVLAWRRAR